MVGKTALKKVLINKLPNESHKSIGGFGCEYAAITLFAISLFLFLSLVSYHPKDPSWNTSVSRPEISNLCGFFGAYISDIVIQLFGVASLLLCPALVLFGSVLILNKDHKISIGDIFCTCVVIVIGAAFVERFSPGRLLDFPPEHLGGTIGSLIHAFTRRLFGSGGGILFQGTILTLCCVKLFKIKVKDVGYFVSQKYVILKEAIQIFSIAIRTKISNWKSGLEHRRFIGTGIPKSRLDDFDDSLVSNAKDAEWEKISPISAGPQGWYEEDELPHQDPSPNSGIAKSDCANTQIDLAVKRQQINSRNTLPELPDNSRYSLLEPIKTVEVIQVKRPSAEAKIVDCDNYFTDPEEMSSTVDSDIRELLSTKSPQASCKTRGEEIFDAAIDTYLREISEPKSDNPNERIPKLISGELETQRRTNIDKSKMVSRNDTVKIPQPQAAMPSISERADLKENNAPKSANLGSKSIAGDYVLPSLDLLDVPPRSRKKIDQITLQKNAAVVEQKLAELGVKGKVVHIHPGPVITMYELALAPGIPLRRVLNMSDDLAMALKSGSTRVVAPIPGKDTVGIEVPNLDREIVYFREIIESSAFSQSHAPLKMALGKGIDGEPFAGSLANMPHLLIAGATGTGKSVGLNCLICSWLMSCSPDEVKFLMVDPKKLELSYYEDIPHLIHPVVTEAEKVPKVLSWAIKEMERRYDILSRAGAKNIAGYNEKVDSGHLKMDLDGNPVKKLPYIIIIIDELAELMMVAAKDIEISIARLAQMARAAGIHLILATQRPSVDVITGVIKANFPARLSFQVSAKPDSRTILDTTGAENLLGMGDMLFLPPGTAKMRRLHGPYVSENEIKRVVDFIKQQRSPVYIQEITKHVAEEDGKTSAMADFMEDPKYDEAVELVSRLGHASISLIQRHMRIGYNRAARIIEAMESEGIIGPSDGTSRPREVLAQSLHSVPDGSM